ncbi:MAG: alpha/beta fold hydrolase [Spirochaetales bacterium]|nr:alpha/beta fold hydrolase [Spirochaetales bacterium]
MDRIDSGGVELAYELSGADVKGTVVLLNGIAMSIAHWKPVAAALAAAGFRVLCHDFRGQLLSDKGAGPYSLEMHARDLAALLDALGIGGRVHLLGTSYGAEVALAFARDFPERSASLCMVDGVCEADSVLRAAVDSWKRAASAGPSLFYRTILPWNYSSAWLDANAVAVASREAAMASLPVSWYEAFIELCDAFLAIELRNDLGKVACPTLVVAAELDILKGPRYARVMVEGIRGARYAEISGAGHAVVVEKPDEVSRLALDFLDDVG